MADGNYALKGAIKGLVAGLRGVTAGKLAVKKAKTERARQEATIALENRRQNFAEAQAFLKHQIELSKEQRETKELDNEETAVKAQEARQKEEQQRLKDLNDDYEEAEEDLTDLENQLDNEIDPEKRKTLREQISTKRSRLLRISNRIGNRTTGLEAQQKSELDEKTDAAAHTRAPELEGEEGKQERLTIQEEQDIEKEKAAAEAQAAEQTRLNLELLEKHKDVILEKKNGQAIYDALKLQVGQNPEFDLTTYLKEPNETATAMDTLFDIEDADVVGTTLSIAGHTGFDAAERDFFMQTISRLEKDGKRDGTLKIWGKALNNLDKTGLAPLRFGLAKQLVDIRSDLRELKDKYGIETGKILARFTENMTRTDLQAGLENWAMEWTNTVDLTEEEKQAAAQIQSRITMLLARFLKEISGSDVTDEEFGQVRSMLPVIFAENNINAGTIDGNLDYIMNEQRNYYQMGVGDKFLPELMRVMGWNEIRTSDAEKERQATLQLKPADETSFLEKVKQWKDKGGSYQGYINELKKRGMRPPLKWMDVTDYSGLPIEESQDNAEPA